MALEKKIFENSGRRRRTDDGPWLYYTKGSGELKIRTLRRTTFNETGPCSFRHAPLELEKKHKLPSELCHHIRLKRTCSATEGSRHL